MSTFLVLIIFAAWTYGRCRAHLLDNFTENGTALILDERADVVANLRMTSNPRPEYEPHQPDLLPTSVPLVIQGKAQNSDVHWLVPIKLGNRALNVMVHTAFYIFWAKYKPRDMLPDEKFHRLKYTNSPQFAGYEYTDRITLGETEISGDVKFIAATKVDRGLEYHGILGLQLKNEEDGLPGIVPYFLSKEAKPRPVFALYLGLTGSQIHIGGPHALYYRGKIEYHAVAKFPRYAAFWSWQIAGGSIHVNRRRNVVSGITTEFDSSTRFIYGPTPLVDRIYKEIQGHSDFREKHTFPCSLKPVIKFQWNNGNNWVLDPEEFNLGPVHAGAKMCKGVIKGIEEADDWSFGTSFLRTVYTVYEMDQKTANHRIGIAMLSLPPSPPLPAPPPIYAVNP